MNRFVITILFALVCGGALAQERTFRKPGGSRIIAPAYRQAWSVEAPEGATHIGVGDVTGDKTPRILLSNAANLLMVYKLDATTLKREAAIDLGANGGTFAIGRFLAGKPEAVVAPNVMYLWDGANYARTALPDLKSVAGSARYADGAEEVLQWEPNGAPQTWAFDAGRIGAVSTGRGIHPPNMSAGFAKLVVIRGTPDFLAQLDAAGEFGKAGVVGGFDPRGDGSYYLWAPKVTADGSYFTVSSVDAKPVWTSAKLDGKILDVAHCSDPKGTKQKGVCLLLAGADGKSRSVVFFALIDPER